MMGTNRVDAVLTQRAGEDGFTKKEIQELLDHLNLREEEEVEAIYLNADSCVLFGFIRMQICEERLNFDTGEDSSFGQAAISVANDMELETRDKIYYFAEVKTYMYY